MKKIFFLALLGCSMISIQAFSDCTTIPGCTIWDCGDFDSICYDEDSPAVPIDGGVSLLIAGGAALGLGGLYKKRKKANV